MANATSDPKQATQAPSPAHDGWLTRAEVAAELGYRSIFPIRKMEGTKLHPVREARGWVFDPVEVAALKATRTATGPARPSRTDGQIAARVFYLFDHGRELREVVQEAEVPPSLVRELWHEWLTDLHEGEVERRKTTQEERRLRREEKDLREIERRNEQEQKNFETIMGAMAATALDGRKG
jgi:hypothetical protein